MQNLTTDNSGSYHITTALAGKHQKPPTYNWLKLLIVSALGFFLLLCSSAKAVETDKVAHFAVSYGATTAVYALYKAILNKDCRLDRKSRATQCALSPGERFGAASFAAVTVVFAGLMKEMGDSQVDKGDILANGLGAATANVSIVLFEF